MEKKILILGSGKVSASLFKGASLKSDEKGNVVYAACEQKPLSEEEIEDRFKQIREKYPEKDLVICVSGAGKVGKHEIEAVLAERGIKHSGVMLVGEAPLQTAELTSEDVVNLVALRTKEVAQRLTIEEIDNKVNLHSYCQEDLRFLEKQNSQAGWKNRPKHRR